MQRQLHFVAGCKLVDPTGHHDMTRLQSLLLASTFLIFVSRLSVAYTYINLAVSSAAQMGLLSDDTVPSNISSYHAHLSDRTIATLINIDLYLSTVLGLQPAIRTETAEKRMSEQAIGSMKDQCTPNKIPECNQNASQSFEMLKRNYDITQLTASTLQTFQEPVSLQQHDSLHNVGIDEATLRKAARDLASLSKDLSSPLSPSAGTTRPAPTISSVARSEGDFALYWSQLSTNIPFLHYLRPLADGQPIPDSASRPALTCLKIAVNVIIRSEGLLKSLTESDTYSQFMHPSNWTCIYTIFLAVVALVFLISIHEGTSKPSEAWRKADSGIRILTALRCGDRGATLCLAVIKKLVRQLNYTVDFDFDTIEKTTRRVCERQTKLPTLSNILGTPFGQTTWSSPVENSGSPHQSTVDGSGPVEMSSADKMLALAQSLLLKTDATNIEPEFVD